MLPEIKIISYVAFIAGLFIIENIYFYLLVFILMLTLLVRIPLKLLVSGWIPISLFLGFTFIGNLFFHHGRIIYQAGPLLVTEEGLNIALLRTIRIFFMITGAKILTATTGVEPLINAFGRLLKPFERIGVPVGDFISITDMAIKSLPRLREYVVKAYRETFKDNNIKGFRKRATAISSFLMPLFIKSIQSPKTFFNEEVQSETPIEQNKRGNDYY